MRRRSAAWCAVRACVRAVVAFVAGFAVGVASVFVLPMWWAWMELRDWRRN